MLIMDPTEDVKKGRQFLVLVFLLGYMTISACVYTMLEPMWSFLDSFYFCLVSLASFLSTMPIESSFFFSVDSWFRWPLSSRNRRVHARLYRLHLHWTYPDNLGWATLLQLLLRASWGPINRTTRSSPFCSRWRQRVRRNRQDALDWSRIRCDASAERFTVRSEWSDETSITFYLPETAHNSSHLPCFFHPDGDPLTHRERPKTYLFLVKFLDEMQDVRMHFEIASDDCVNDDWPPDTHSQ